MRLPEAEPAMLLPYGRRALSRPLETVKGIAGLLPSILLGEAVACLAISQGVALAPRRQIEGIRAQTRLPLRQEALRALPLTDQIRHLPTRLLHRILRARAPALHGEGAGTLRPGDTVTPLSVAQTLRETEVAPPPSGERLVKTGVSRTLHVAVLRLYDARPPPALDTGDAPPLEVATASREGVVGHA